MAMSFDVLSDCAPGQPRSPEAQPGDTWDWSFPAVEKHQDFVGEKVTLES